MDKLNKMLQVECKYENDANFFKSKFHCTKNIIFFLEEIWYVIQKRCSSLDPACWSDGDEPELRKSRRRKYESSTSSRFVLGKRSSSACSYFKEYIIKDEDRFDFLSYKHALRTEALIEW